MLGLEIRINDQEPIIVASDEFVFANLAFGYSSDKNVVMGGDILRYITWFRGKPEKGDKVVIRVVETGLDKVSPVLSMKDRDRVEMKKWYEYYKVELQAKGLI